MKPIEQALADYLPTVNDVFDLRHVANEGQIQPLADICYELLEGVDWLAVANAVAAKEKPVYEGEPISLADSFVGYNGDPESISDEVEPVIFSIYDTVIDENTPIEMIERILESGEFMLQYESYDDYCGSKMYREPNGEYTTVAFAAREEWHLHTGTEIEEAWDWFLLDSKNIRVVDAPQPAEETETVEWEYPYGEPLEEHPMFVRFLLDNGYAVHYDTETGFCNKTMMMRNGEYVVIYEYDDGEIITYHSVDFDRAYWHYACLAENSYIVPQSDVDYGDMTEFYE